MGATNPRKAAPGTIRGDLGILFTENLVHGSDSLGIAAARDRHLLPESVTNQVRARLPPRSAIVASTQSCDVPTRGAALTAPRSSRWRGTTRSRSAATWPSISARPTP